jgi:hypothetical protein
MKEKKERKTKQYFPEAVMKINRIVRLDNLPLCCKCRCRCEQAPGGGDFPRKTASPSEDGPLFIKICASMPHEISPRLRLASLRCQQQWEHRRKKKSLKDIS